MRRTLHLAFIAIVVGTAGLTAAQSSPPTSPGATPTAPTPIDPAQTVPVGQTTWMSQDGSILELAVDPAGTLTGTFLPGFPCGSPSAVAPAPRAIVGTVNGNALGWTLSLPECPSVGTWVGHYRTVEAQEQLDVLWHLALPEVPPGVGSTLTGSTVFVRQTVQ
jgi:hypothetical protein